MRLLPILPLVFLAVAAAASQDEPERRDYQYAEGRAFEVFATWSSEQGGDATAEQALRVAEAVAAQLAARTGLHLAPEGEQPARALINLYQRPKDLGQLRRSMGMEPEAGQPFMEAGGGVMHLAIQPALSNRTLSEVGLPSWTLRQIGRKAGSSWVERVAPGQLAGPASWAWEGLVLGAVQAALERSGQAQTASLDPSLGQEYSAVAALLEQGQQPQDLLALESQTAAGRGVRRVLAGALVAPQGQGLGEWLRSGGDPLAALEDPLGLLQAARASFVGKELEVAAYGTVERGWVQAALGNRSSRCWSREPVGREEYTLSGRLTLYAPLVKSNKKARPGGQVNLLLGRVGEEYISVVFNTITGVTVYRYEALTGEYRILVEQKSGAFVPANTPFEFRVQIGPKIGSIELNGRPITTFTTDGRDMTGQYGTGAQAGCGVALWTELRLE